jgi:hypothetical protein
MEVESMSFKLCEKFDKLNLRIVANKDVWKWRWILLYSRIFKKFS